MALRTFEIARTGTFPSWPKPTTLTSALLKSVVATFGSDGREVPVTEGHWPLGESALGWVKRVFMDGDNVLKADVETTPTLEQRLYNKELRHRSIGLRWLKLREDTREPVEARIYHLAMLGASQPAIPGMPPITFSAALSKDDTDNLTVVSFSLDDNDTVSDNTAAPVGALSAPTKGIPVADTQTQSIEAQLAEMKATHERQTAELAQLRQAADKATKDLALLQVNTRLDSLAGLTPAVREKAQALLGKHLSDSETVEGLFGLLGDVTAVTAATFKTGAHLGRPNVPAEPGQAGVPVEAGGSYENRVQAKAWKLAQEMALKSGEKPEALFAQAEAVVISTGGV